MDKTIRKIIVIVAAVCLASGVFFAGVFLWLYVKTLLLGPQALASAVVRNAAGFAVTVLLPLFLGIVLLLALFACEKQIEAAATEKETANTAKRIEAELAKLSAAEPKKTFFGFKERLTGVHNAKREK